jgi:dihydroxyacid dehydratase/phosphogluconate dehydratase
LPIPLQITEVDLQEIELELCSTGGTCMVMGTASTLACLGEAFGLSMPGSASLPSGSGKRLRQAVAAGRHAVELAHNPIRPLAMVQNGDRIKLDVSGGRLDLLVFDEELQRRRSLITLPSAEDLGWKGYRRFHFEHVLQADEGCDLDLW